jgi:anti-anti-sigma factor
MTRLRRCGVWRTARRLIGDVPVTFSCTTEHGDGSAVRLDLAGDLHGCATAQLRLRLVETIIIERPDELIIDLGALNGLSSAGLAALICGYVAAIDYGTSYRVVNARHDVRRVIEESGTLDMLADSDDVGSLLLALLLIDGSRI